ncbi:antiviral innate immune response receptor RIG-I-like isoform X1 [Mercenaria mercenaria]|uniref:antiviral innate immune response receptor RIG-I-like isoform X1 n=1 Tax=Mercenaria mercenaria TaxID=6596 RepID=UPI00234EBAC2|nr:antiviral innate immune response receptor RIG-I-like isoform X1 [Mercenaria mercenaria]
METEKKTPVLSEVVTLGERAPPEGHDVNGNSSGDDGETQNTPKLSKTIKIEKVEQNEDVPQNDKTNLVANESDSETEESDDSSDETTDDVKPLAQKLYPFQLELAENALAGKNTIICAPTGSGKTWVALYIIDSHLQSAADAGQKKVVFMARNGALVKQQMDFISKQLPFARVKHLKGDTEEAMMMHAFLEDYDIFLFTPQILVNNLSTDVKSLSVFSLMVFDECHHTRGSEPYSMLMKNYLMEKEKLKGTKNLPQIIGLTASIGTGRAKSQKDALDHIFRVCASLDVRCLSTVEKNREDLAKHVSVPSEETIPMKRRPFDPCRSILLQAVKETGDFLEDIALMDPKLIQVMHKCPSDVESKRYAQWVAEVIKVAESLTRGQGRNIASCAKYLQIYYNALEINRLLRIPDVAFYIATQHVEEAEYQDSFTKEETQLLKKLKELQKELRKLNAENPNVHAMSKILSNLFAGEDADVDSRAMVFVHARATCRALADFLNDELEGNYVKTSPFLGKETRGADKGMTEDEQTYILEEFREGTFKVLVATSVGMEGLDVPDCNMTLNYNFNVDEIKKIQMSGRSRKQKGKAVMIATDAQFVKDKITLYRIKLMTGAVEEFKKLDQNSVNRQVLAVQKKLLDDHKWQLKTRELKRIKQSDAIDYGILCRKCDAFVCNASDVRKFDTSYMVALRGFGEKICKKEHTKRANMGALKKKYKMFCQTCPKDWGVIAVKDDIEYYVLKLENLKFVSSKDQEDVTTYKKWSEVPYKITELGIKDLSRMYDETN